MLRRRGFVAITAGDAGQLGRTDAEQLAYATQREMAMPTHNRDDFEQLARQYIDAGRNHSGILIAVRRRPHEIARRVVALLDQMTADEMDNQLLYI